MAREPVTIEAPTAALDAVIRQRHAPAQMKQDLEGYLRAQGVEGEDLAAMLAVGATRMLVYRQLVHSRLRNTVREFIPRTAARRGARAYREDIGAFIDARGAHSPYLRDVPAEFVAWVVPVWTADPDVPTYLTELAQHELLSLDVRNDWRGGEAATDLPLALDRPLRFDGATRLARYEYAVHQLPKSVDDDSTPAHEPTRLLVYRDDKHAPRYLALTPFAFALMQQLLEQHKAVADGLRAACEELGVPLDDEHLASAAQLFADLGERGVCLGTEPHEPD